ncbi:poly [ADP-ribose] polymerase tankyrase-2-like [Lineus longissimus]|uniref:poly [ADP-ribose] polymerase tankyrase-2-like n=1 Tax=Lineus longissimus TaxID=88925 RepID=UPI00315CA29D
MEELAEESAWQKLQTLLATIGNDDIDELEKTRIVGSHSNEDIQCALRIAVKRRSFDTAKFLLEQGVSPNETDKRSSSPLAIACSNTDMPMVKLLLSFGADPYLLKVDGDKSPISVALLDFAMKRGDSNEEVCKEIFRLLLDVDELANESERNRPMALLAAVESGCLDKAARILHSGVCVSEKITVAGGEGDEVDLNPMNEACKNRDTKMMKLLSTYGAQPFEHPASDDDDSDIFDCAAGTAILNSDYDMVEAILDLDPEGKKQYLGLILFMLFWRGQVEIIENVLLHVPEWNINMDIPCEREQEAHLVSPLHVTIHSNRPEMCCWLLENGVDVNASKIKGSVTPLMSACECGFSDVVLCLLERGALVNVVDARGYTAAHYACRSENLDEVHSTIRHLLNHGANIQTKCRIGHREPIEHLMDNPVVEEDLFSDNNRAALAGFAEALCLLLGAGAKVHVDTLLTGYNNNWDQIDSHDELDSLFSIFLRHGTQYLPPNFTKLVTTVVETENFFLEEISDLLGKLNSEANTVSIHRSTNPELLRSIAFLQEYLKNANLKSLKDLCRLRLRQAIRPPLWATVQSRQFEFPKLLKKYLLFE